MSVTSDPFAPLRAAGGTRSRRGAAHPDHRAAPAAGVRRPAGHVGQPRHQPVRPADRRARRHHGRLGGPGDRRDRGRLRRWARCCSARRRFFGRTTGAPAMVALRGLLGRRGSVRADDPQHRAEHRLGHDGDHRHLHRGRRRGRRGAGAGRSCSSPAPSRPMMAVRPLGSVRLLRKVMVWLVLAASVFLFVQVLMQPRPADPAGRGPRLLAGRRPCGGRRRLVRAAGRRLQPALADRSAAFWGASLGYGLAAIAYYALGVFAVANLGASDVITALVTLPAGGDRAGHPARRRGRRSVRQRLLDHHVGAEPVAQPRPAGRRGDHRGDRDRCWPGCSTSASTSRSCS